jgi:hypothetical protein
MELGSALLLAKLATSVRPFFPRGPLGSAQSSVRLVCWCPHFELPLATPMVSGLEQVEPCRQPLIKAFIALRK